LTACYLHSIVEAQHALMQFMKSMVIYFTVLDWYKAYLYISFSLAMFVYTAMFESNINLAILVGSYSSSCTTLWNFIQALDKLFLQLLQISFELGWLYHARRINVNENSQAYRLSFLALFQTIATSHSAFTLWPKSQVGKPFTCIQLHLHYVVD
jgi:hypothetical protein